MNKRFLHLALVFIIINSQLLKASYFSASYTGNPFSPMSFLVTSVYVDGHSIEKGDEIGIFDGTVCVGNYTSDGHSGFGMTSSMSDPSSNTVGFIPGHTISFQLWTKNSGTLYRNIAVQFNNEMDTIFKPLGIAVIKLTAVKDPPKAEIISGQSFSLSEYSINNIVVGKVAANYDIHKKYLFEIQSGNAGNAFKIDTLSGIISVNVSSALNYNIQNKYSLVVKLYNQDCSWVYDTSSVLIALDKISEESEFKNKITDTAYVGQVFERSFDLKNFNQNDLSLSQVEIPSWLSYRKENNSLIIQGIAKSSDEGEYTLKLAITDGYNVFKNNIDLKVLPVVDDLSVISRNNPSKGDFSLSISSSVNQLIEIKVYNLKGLLIYHATYENESGQFVYPVDITNHPKGTYIFEVKNGQNRSTGNLVLM